MQDKIATRDAYGQALLELGRKRSEVVALDADLSKSTKTALFAKEFPLRFFNMGISEADMMGTAAGLAASGYIPFASTFGVFATGRVYDQIRNSIAYPNLNVKIAASHAGITVGEDGASHQALEDIALMRVLPNMTVIVPADGYQAAQAVEAVCDFEGPVYLRLGRPKVPRVIPAELPFKLGRAQLLQEGDDVTLVAAGIMVGIAMEAAAMLLKEGLTAAVVNMHTIKPLDQDMLLRQAAHTGAVVTAEEHSIIGGLGGAVAEALGESHPVPILRVGVKDTFGESGTPDKLMQKYGLTVENLAEHARSAVKMKKK